MFWFHDGSHSGALGSLGRKVVIGGIGVFEQIRQVFINLDFPVGLDQVFCCAADWVLTDAFDQKVERLSHAVHVRLVGSVGHVESWVAAVLCAGEVRL